MLVVVVVAAILLVLQVIIELSKAAVGVDCLRLRCR